MAGFETILENNVNLQLGTKPYGPFLVDADVRSIHIVFSRNQWTNPAARLDLIIACNGTRDGQPFSSSVSLVAVGGPAIVGRPNDVRLRYDVPAGVTGRQLSGTYVVSGQRLRTTVTLIAEV